MAQFFIDSAVPEEIRLAAERFHVDGVTTNPVHLKEAGLTAAKVLAAIGDPPGPISFQCTATDAEALVAEGQALSALHPNAIVKIAVSAAGLAATARLAAAGCRVNVTACVSATQAALASRAGAWCASLFLSKIEGAGRDYVAVLETARRAFDAGRSGREPCRLLAASVRHEEHVAAALLAGADIVTMRLAVYTAIVDDPLTEEIRQVFAAAAR